MKTEEVPEKLRVLTLNCWGLPDWFNKLVESTTIKNLTKPLPKREDRMKSIANELGQYDIICLQEVWKSEDFKLFARTAELSGIRHYHMFSSGLLDSCGLAILSRFPFEEVHFHPYRVNGHAPRLDHGDYHVGKGVGFARVKLTPTQSIYVFTSHLIAKYKVHDKYLPDRLSQAWELGSLIRLSTAHLKDQLVLVMGDFNFPPNSLEYEVLMEVGQLRDSWALLQKGEGITHNDSIDGKLVPKRIDYVLFNRNTKYKIENVKVVMDHSQEIFSDHFGVSATFSSLSPSSSSSTSLVQNNAQKIVMGGVGGAYHLVQEGMEEAKKRRMWHLARALLCLICLFVFHWVSVPLVVMDLLWICVAVEIFAGSVVGTSDIHAFAQIVSEMKFFITQSME